MNQILGQLPLITAFTLVHDIFSYFLFCITSIVLDVLTVQNVAIEGNAVIEVLDIEGRVIISKNVSNVFGNYTIDMSGVESGVYFVKVTADTEVQKVRVVKQ